MITVKYDADGNSIITPLEAALTIRQFQAMERIQEWFTPRNTKYTIQDDGWINEVQK